MKTREKDRPNHDITDLLQKAHDGDQQARDELLAAVYPVLQQMARKFLSPTDRAARYLNPSDLLNEAVYRLIKQPEVKDSGHETTAAPPPDPRSLLERYHFENRARFYALVGKVMRNLITDQIRHAYGQAGEERVYVTLTGVEPSSPRAAISWQEFNRALTKLAAHDPQAASIVELRLFWEMTIEETAEATGLSRATVVRDTRYGKAFLAKEFGWHHEKGAR